MEKPKSLTSKLNSLIIDSFQVIEALPEGHELDHTKFQFQMLSNAGLMPAEKQVVAQLEIKIFSNTALDLQLGSIATRMIFDVHNYDDIEELKAGQIPPGVAINFLGIVISTTRGILFAKSAGTVLNGVILPVINPAAFFPKAIVLPEKTK
jgi:hypothetical protein